ncbi:MAG: discoidin domain-containing protein [Lachnospiraceae bacterium]|nr:discoidin domain-containing protein [Lachnospiraceae bacterium]
MKYTVYVNGAVHSADLSISELNDIASIATMISTGSLLIDNLRVYDGKELKTNWNDNNNPESIYDDSTQAKRLLSGLVAVQLNSNALYANNVKSFATKEFDLSEAGKVYVALEDIKTLFGVDVNLTGLSEKSGAYDIYVVAEANGYQVVSSLADRMIVFGKTAVTWSSDERTEVNRYLQFDRPDAEIIKDLYNQFKTTNNGDVHPSLILTQSDVDRIHRLYKSGETYIKLWGDQAIAAANSALNAADYTFTEKSNGGITDISNAVGRLINLGVAYFLNDDPAMKAKYFEKAKAQVMNICALEDFNPSPNGSYLDTGELSFMVGLTYDWFYDEFTEDERAYIEKNLMEKAVGVHHKAFYGMYSAEEVQTSWNNVTNNWNAVCNGGQMLGAMALFDKYPDICADMIANALRSMEKVMSSYYPEGVWKEGGTYWRYALYYIAYSMQTFTKVLGEDFGFLCTPGLDQTGWYGMNLAGSTAINNFGDTSSDFINNHAVLWCATQFRDKELMAVRLEELEGRGWSGGARSILHYDETLLGDTTVELPLDTLTNDMNIGGLRQNWYDTDATYLGFSGTKDKNNHAHMDSGSFVVDMLGERIVVEGGVEDYSKSGYFNWNGNRSYYFCVRPEGHNIYIINPTDTADDYGGFTPWATTTSTPLVSKAQGAFTSIDLSKVYAEDTNSAIRGYMLTDDRRNVLVRDEIDLKWASDVYSHLFVSGEVEFDEEDPNRVILTKNGKKFLVVIDVQGDKIESYTFKAMEAKARGDYGVVDKTRTGITKLEIHVKTSDAGLIGISMKIMAYGDPAADAALITTPIAQWSADMIPDGDVRELPSLDMIYVNGEPLEGFDPAVTGYTGQLSLSEMLPVVTAASSVYNRIEVIPATDFGEDYVIKVYDNEDDSRYKTYYLNYTRVQKLKPVDGRERYPITNATESGISTNNAMNGGAAWAVDNDFDVTRWGVLGNATTSHWMMFELEDVRTIYKIGLNQTFGGTGRNVVFTLEASLDGETWTTIYDGKSSGTTTALEYYIDSTEGIQAKFIRYTSPGGINKGSDKINNYSHTVNELVILGAENVTEYYELDSNKLVEMFCSINAENLISVTLGENVVAAENYTLTNTNIGVFSLKPEYLNTLTAGTYKLTLTYNDGSSENKEINTSLVIEEAGASAVKIIEAETVKSYLLGSKAVVTIKCSGNKDELTGVMVNDKLLPATNYEVTEGSTIVTLKEDYVESLTAGTYKIKLLYSGERSVESELEIKEKTTGAADETTGAAEETTGAADETTGAAGETTGAADETTGAADETTDAAEESTAPGTDAAPGGDPGTGDMSHASSWLWLFMAAMVVMTGCATFRFEKRREK